MFGCRGHTIVHSTTFHLVACPNGWIRRHKESRSCRRMDSGLIRFCRTPLFCRFSLPRWFPVRPSMSAPPRATTFTFVPLFVHPHCTTTHSARVCIVGCTYDSALSDLTHYFHAWTSVPAGSSRPTDRPSAHPAVGCSCFTLYIYVVAQALESACVVCVLVLSLFDFPVGIHVGFSRVQDEPV